MDSELSLREQFEQKMLQWPQHSLAQFDPMHYADNATQSMWLGFCVAHNAYFPQNDAAVAAQIAG